MSPRPVDSPTPASTSPPPRRLCAVLLAALGLFVACRGEPSRVVRYDDLVTDASGLEIGAADDARAQLYCADQTHWVRPLADGNGISLPVDFGDEPRLVLTWCRQTPDRGELTVRVSGEGEATQPVEGRMAVDGIPRWQHWELDLAPLAGHRGRVEVKVSLDGDGQVLLRDAYVVHRTPRAAGWPRGGVHVEAEERESGRTEIFPGTAAATPSAGVTDGAAWPDDAVPRILLVSLDTLRADHVGAVAGLDAEHSPTPHLDALAAEGEVFAPHWAAASWTKPSHGSILTGYPSLVHGAETVEAPLAPGVPTLAERLREAGLATGGMVHDCVWLNPKFGFQRGFDDYRSVKWRSGQIARAAVNWMAAHRDGPFFFFLHTFDPHSDFRHLPYEGPDVDTASVRRRFAVDRYGCRQGRCASDLLTGLGKGDLEALPGEAEILDYLYTAGVRETDSHLGRLFDDLRRLGLWDDLTVVVTSDHGEMLLEDGRTLHGQPWNPVLRVPLIVKWAHGERAGRRTEVPTSSLDLAPTLLAVAGVGADDLPGSDLRRPRRDRPIFSLHDNWWVVVRGRYKGLFRSSGKRAVYDLETDPGDEHDLSAERPELTEELENEVRALHRWSAATRESLGQGAAPSSRILSDEERDRLRALGYLQ